MPRSLTTARELALPVVPNFALPSTAPAFVWPLTAGLTAGATFVAGTPTFSRASIDWCPSESGAGYTLAPANTGHYNAQGVFIRPGRTNFCTNFNAAPDAELTNISVAPGGGTLSRVQDPTALALAGLSDICPTGYLFRYVNNSGVSQTVSIAGATSSVSNASIRAFARASGGVVTMQLTGGLGTITIQNRAEIIDYRKANISGLAGTEVLQFVVPDRVTLDWVLNQLEVGANVTTPIVVAGATAAVNSTILTIPQNGNFPTNDFVVYLEATPYGIDQDSSSPVLLSAYVDANNYLQIGNGGPIQGTKRIAGVASSSNSRGQYQLETMSLALRVSSSRGVEIFVNGMAPQSPNANVDPISLTSGNLNIGRKGDNSQYFTGRIRNVRIYNSALSDAALIRMTTPQNVDMAFVANMGSPCYDPRNPSRIWSMLFTPAPTAANPLAGTWKDIYYSDDWGNTWTLWFTMPGASTQETICMDRNGNIYFADSLKLNRIDAQTKAVTTACTFVANTTAGGAGPGVTPGAIGSVWTWLNWHFTEDDEGNIYVGQYQTTQLGGQFMWKSPAGGNSFTRIDTFVDGVDAGYNTNRHVHNLKCNPFDNSIYVSIGDDAANRMTYRSTNKFATGVFATDGAKVVTSLLGPTGLTFTSEAAYIGTDSTNNVVQSSLAGAAGVTRYAPGNPLQTSPIFWLVAVNDNEMWATICEDNLGSAAINQWSALVKLVKNKGLDNGWQAARIIGYDAVRANGNGYHAISCNSRGVIPASSPYVFVARRRYSSAHGGGAIGFCRVKRAA